MQQTDQHKKWKHDLAYTEQCKLILDGGKLSKKYVFYIKTWLNFILGCLLPLTKHTIIFRVVMAVMPWLLGDKINLLLIMIYVCDLPNLIWKNELQCNKKINKNLMLICVPKAGRLAIFCLSKTLIWVYFGYIINNTKAHHYYFYIGWDGIGNKRLHLYTIPKVNSEPSL